MKSKRLLLMLLVALCAPWAAMAQSVTIGEGTSTSQYLPSYSYFKYAISQQIYTADEIDASGTITSISFYNTQGTGTNNARKFKIYMAHTDKSSFTSTSDWIALTSDNLVYEATSAVTLTPNTWTSLTLNAPFAYNGTDNLVVAVIDNSGNFSSGTHNKYRVFSIDDYQALYAYSDSYSDLNPDGTNGTNNIAGTRLQSKNQIVLGGIQRTCAKPTGLASANVTHNSATISWTENGVATAWVLQYGTDNTFAANTEVNVTTNPTTSLSGLTSLTTYFVRVKPDCDTYGTHWSSTFSFSTTAEATAVGDSWSDDFEGTSCDWELINGTLTNAWAWGTATNNGGTHALYVSNDGGTTNAYTNGSAAMVYATKLLNFTEGKFEFAYNWMANGESTWDFLRVALVPASVTLTAGTSLPSGLTYSTVPSGWIALDGGSKLNLVTDWQSQSVAVNVPAGYYYLVMAWRDDTSGGTNPPAAVDNVSITRVTCGYDVEGLAVSNITTTTAAIAWTAGEPGQWQVAIKEGADEWDIFPTIANTNTYTITGLNPSTNYQVKVRAYCGGSDYGSWCNPISFATACDVIDAVGYSENFDSYTAGSGVLPICWNKINTTTTNYYQGYPYIYNYGASSSPNFLYFYSYYSTSYDPQDQYAILPEMDGLNGKQVTLMAKGSSNTSTFKIGTMSDPTDASTFVAITEQALTTSYQEFEYVIPASASGNYLAIMIDAANESRTANGAYIDDISITEVPACAKPTNLAVVNNSVTGHSATISWTSDGNAWQIGYTATGGTEQYVEVTENPYTLTGLAPETAYQVRVQNNCGSGVYSIFTNAVSFTTTVACPAPTVAVTNITTTTADVTCTNTDASAFNVQLINPNATPADTTTFANVSMPYTLTGLTQNTSYRVRVKALCGGEDGESAWSNGTNFMTAEECPDGMVCIGAGTATSPYVPTHNYFKYSLTEQIYTAAEIGQAGAILSIDFFKAATTEMERVLDIYMVATDKDEFTSSSDWITVTAADLVYSGTVTFADNDWTTIVLDNPFIHDGTSNVCIVVDDNTGSYVNTTHFRVFTAEKYQTHFCQDDDTNFDPTTSLTTTGNIMTLKNRIRIAIGEPPACPKPTGLTVDYEGGTEATISWTGDATAWNMRVNGTPINGTITNPYTLTGLELATTYEVEVQADCGDSQSDWTNAASFTTDLCMPENQCEITFELTDSYGDGWNSAYIAVVDFATGEELAQMSADNHGGGNVSYTDTKTLSVCDGREITFEWHAGGYDSEASYVVYDINGEVIFEDSGAMSAPVNYTVSCTVSTCRKPTDLSYGNLGSTTAVLSWTENGEATEWVVAYKEATATDFTEVNAATNPFTLEGLTPETAYTVKVKPECDDSQGEWSNEVNFTTLEACPTPSNITITPTQYTADITWNGDSDSYNVQYRTAATMGSPIFSEDFSNGIGDWTMVDCHSSTGVSNGAFAFHWNTNPPQYLISPEITGITTDAILEFEYKDESWQESFQVGYSTTNNDITSFTFGTEIVTPEDSQWHTYSGTIPANTKYICIKCNSYDKYYLYIDNIVIANTIPAGEWTPTTPISTTEKSCQLTELTSDTKYDVQIQGVCDNVPGNWANASFTTVPIRTFTTVGNWNVASNWTPAGVPGENDDVAIAEHAIIPANYIAKVNNIDMKDGGSIFINNDGSSTTNSGQLWHNNDGVQATVNVRVYGYTTTTVNRNDYQLIASPFAGSIAIANTLIVETAYDDEFDLYKFDQSEDLEWLNYKENPKPFTELVNGQGYLYANSKSGWNNFTLDGVLRASNTDQEVSLSYKANAEFAGWNLVGNPFACNAYVLNNNDNNVPYYKMNSNGNGFEAVSNGAAIAPLNGIFVQATAEGQNIRFTRNAPSGAKGGMLNVNLSQDNHFADNAIIRFDGGSTLEKFSFRANSSKVFVSENNKDYAVVNAGHVGEIPVSFKAEKNGSYRLSFTSEEVTFSYLHLIDNMTGADVDLLANPTYSFDARTTDYESRFRLVFATGSSVDGDSFGFINGMGNLTIFGIEGEATLQVIDVTGRMLSSETFSGSYEKRLNVAPGVYMLRLINGNDVKVQKMVVR